MVLLLFHCLTTTTLIGVTSQAHYFSMESKTFLGEGKFFRDAVQSFGPDGAVKKRSAVPLLRMLES